MNDFFERERAQAGERGRGRERILSWLHAQHRAGCGARSRNPGITPWAGIKSRTLDRLSRPGAPERIHFHLCYVTKSPHNPVSYLAPNYRVAWEESESEPKFCEPKPQPQFTPPPPPPSSLLRGSRMLDERQATRDTVHQRVLAGRPRAESPWASHGWMRATCRSKPDPGAKPGGLPKSSATSTQGISKVQRKLSQTPALWWAE